MSEEKLEMLEMTINADKVFDVNFHNVSKELLKAYKDLQQENEQLKSILIELEEYIKNKNNWYQEIGKPFEPYVKQQELLEILGEKENEQ